MKNTRKQEKEAIDYLKKIDANYFAINSIRNLHKRTLKLSKKLFQNSDRLIPFVDENLQFKIYLLKKIENFKVLVGKIEKSTNSNEIKCILIWV
jgi:hypothetical protein